MKSGLRRCEWSESDPLYIRYHDTEWGVPLHEDRKLFEFLTLEGAQAGLSWLTILKRRREYRKAFENFDPETVSGYGQDDITRLMANKGIIRNRLKINSTISNAKAFVKVQKEYGSFDNYIWDFVNGKPIINRWLRMGQVPSRSKESDLLSADLRRKGFNFVGTIICYSHMQATGMVNDHLIHCFRYRDLRG